MIRPPAKPTRSDREVIAALFWDVPALQGGSAAARAFLHLMGPGPWRALDDTTDDALGTAARGLYEERLGNSEEARLLYESLMVRRRYWPSLLGLFLTAWADLHHETDVLSTALKQVRLLDDPQTKARLLIKLASLALDQHRRDFFEALTLEAVTAAEPGSLLHRALAYEAFNFEVSREFPRIQNGNPDPDPLVTLDWIDELALRGARGSLEDTLVSRARSPWSWSFHSGRLPVHELIAAEEQARWAGALWKRRVLRRHAGAQLLLAGDEDQELLLYGLKLWITGGGKDVRNVINLIEPQITSTDGIDDMIRAVIDVSSTARAINSTLGESAVALWDLLSEEILVDLLDRLWPSGELPPEIDIARRFWGLASLRVLNAVEARLPALSAETQAALLEHFPLSALQDLGPPAAAGLVEAADQLNVTSGGALGAAALLASRINRDAARFIKRVQPSELADAVSRFPSGVSPRQVIESERVLRSSLESSIAAASRGTRSFGGRNPAADLAELAAMTHRVTRTTVKLLLRTARNESVPASMRFDVLLALAHLGHEGLVDRRDAQAVGQASELGTRGSFMEQDIPPELLKAAKLLVRSATTSLRGSEEVELLLLVRERDPRVRQIAVNAASIAIASKPSQTLETSVLAALYDPDSRTVGRAIVGIRNAQFTLPGTLRAALQRFSALMEESTREVRREVAHAAKAILTRSNRAEAEEAAQIVDMALHDRSWSVRREASLNTPNRDG